MNMFRGMPARVVPWLLLAAAGALAWGTVSATSTDSSVQVQVSGQVGDTQLQSSSSDSLTGTTTESISFSGKAVIKAKVVDDPDFRTPPIVLLSVDLSGVSGVGQLTRTKYVTTNRQLIQRRLSASDSVRYTFPFWPSGGPPTAGPVGAVSLSLTFNVTTRTLTAATGEITSP